MSAADRKKQQKRKVKKQKQKISERSDVFVVVAAAFAQTRWTSSMCSEQQQQ